MTYAHHFQSTQAIRGDGFVRGFISQDWNQSPDLENVGKTLQMEAAIDRKIETRTETQRCLDAELAP
jgi:hypothetical protein